MNPNIEQTAEQQNVQPESRQSKLRILKFIGAAGLVLYLYGPNSSIYEQDSSPAYLENPINEEIYDFGDSRGEMSWGIYSYCAVSDEERIKPSISELAFDDLNGINLSSGANPSVKRWEFAVAKNFSGTSVETAGGWIMEIYPNNDFSFYEYEIEDADMEKKTSVIKSMAGRNDGTQPGKKVGRLMFEGNLYNQDLWQGGHILDIDLATLTIAPAEVSNADGLSFSLECKKVPVGSPTQPTDWV